MSFSVLVMPVREPEPMPGFHDPADLDAWELREQAHWLYYDFLAGDGSWFDYWHTPAHALGLTLLKPVYREGLWLSTHAEFDQLSAELDLLEAHWPQLPDFSDIRQFPFPETVAEYLSEHLGHLRAAIAVARQHGAQLSIR